METKSLAYWDWKKQDDMWQMRAVCVVEEGSDNSQKVRYILLVPKTKFFLFKQIYFFDIQHIIRLLILSNFNNLDKKLSFGNQKYIHYFLRIITIMENHHVMCCEVEKTYLIQLLIVLKFYKFYSTPISFMHILVLFSCWAQSDYSLFIVISWELHRLSIIFNWQFDFSRPWWYSRQNGVTVKKLKKIPQQTLINSYIVD